MFQHEPKLGNQIVTRFGFKVQTLSNTCVGILQRPKQNRYPKTGKQTSLQMEIKQNCLTRRFRKPIRRDFMRITNDINKRQ